MNQFTPWYDYSMEGLIAAKKDAAVDSATGSYNLFGDTLSVYRTLGFKHYELTDHLGNVLATVLDRKTGYGSSSGNYLGYKADLLSATDYYPFGFEMRASNSMASRFGYNGQMKDNDIAEVQGITTPLYFGNMIQGLDEGGMLTLNLSFLLVVIPFWEIILLLMLMC